MSKFSKDEKDYYQQHFIDLRIPGQTIDDTDFEACLFEHCDFNETEFRMCRFVDCRFQGCNLSVVKVSHSSFNDCVFENCKAIGINWTLADWPNIASFSPLVFFKCRIADATFAGLNLKQMVIEGCDAHDVDFREGRFRNSNFKNTDFANSWFNNTDLSGADFTGAVNYQIDITQNNISKARFSRLEALSLLESLNIELTD